MKFWHKEKFGIILTLSASALLLILISVISISLVKSSPEKRQKVEEQLTKEHKERKTEELNREYQASIEDLLQQVENDSSIEEKFAQMEEFLFNHRVPKTHLDQHLSAAVEFKKTKQRFTSGVVNKEEAIDKIKDLLNSITK